MNSGFGGGLDGAVVLISGGSRGIGRACAEAFAAVGATVIIGYARNAEAARGVVETLSASGGRCEAMALEVSDSACCAATVDAIVERYGRLDVLVNNAGVAIDALLARLKDEEIRRSFAVNVEGAFFLARAACRPMMKQRKGAIVNISSVVGEMGNSGQAVYAATKSALLGMTKSLARELSSRNIRVNAVAPGFVETDMTAAIPEPARHAMAETIPLGRLGRADEVAQAVLFLASDAASYVTGEVLRVNGGMLM